jgi:hypothetical protein
MTPRHSPRSLRHEYQEYVEREVEDYKNSVSTPFLHSIANEAARALDENAQLGMREVLLADEVDRIIARRLRLPSYGTWRRRRLKNANELRRPEHWGLRPDTPLRQALSAHASSAPVLVAGPRLEGSALYLAANGCEVTAVESEVAVVNRVLRAAQDAGLTEKVRGFVADLVSWTPDGPLAAVICTPAAFAGLSPVRTRGGVQAAAAGDDGWRRAPDRDADRRAGGADGGGASVALRRLGDLAGPGAGGIADVRGEEGGGVGEQEGGRRDARGSCTSPVILRRKSPDHRPPPFPACTDPPVSN